ncbi:MAG: inner membrane protein [Arenicella sp.]|jgi:inner membrane protein
MDPLTQGVVGAAASQLVYTNRRNKVRSGSKCSVAILGFLSGMAADLDVLIRSDVDPLLALEYHRQFTHSLIFIPVGALICAWLLRLLLFRRTLTFKDAYLYCFAGYATHAVLDACTTYGTQLFWPFSNDRVAWNNVSVVDPLFTVPLMFLVLLAVFRRSRLWAILSTVYAFSYLGVGVLQNHRVLDIALQIAQSRGHVPLNLGVKPSFANLIVWKAVYEHQGRYYVDAIRAAKSTSVIEGSSTEKLDLAKHFTWLDEGSQQARDVQRFGWFSNQHLAIDPDDKSRIIDIRYSLIPNRMDGMWGIVLDPKAASGTHVKWNTTRPNRDQMGSWINKFWAMIKN